MVAMSIIHVKPNHPSTHLNNLRERCDNYCSSFPFEVQYIIAKHLHKTNIYMYAISYMFLIYMWETIFFRRGHSVNIMVRVVADIFLLRNEMHNLIMATEQGHINSAYTHNPLFL